MSGLGLPSTSVLISAINEKKRMARSRGFSWVEAVDYFLWRKAPAGILSHQTKPTILHKTTAKDFQKEPSNLTNIGVCRRHLPLIGAQSTAPVLGRLKSFRVISEH